MDKSVSRNYIYNVSYQLLVLAAPLVTTPYLSRVLGAEGIGIYSYTTSIVSYFIILATLGVNDYAQREIAYNQNAADVQSRIFFEVSILKIVMIGISLGLYYFCVILPCENQSEQWIYLIQAVNILALIFDVTWFFQGLEEFGKIVSRNFLVKFANIILIFLLVQTRDDLWVYVAVMAGMNLLSGILICFYLPRYLHWVGLRKINPSRNFVVILQLFLPQIAIQVYTVMDKTMLGFLTGMPAENGYYEQAEKVIKMALMLITSLGTVMLPRVAAAFSKGQESLIYDYMMKAYRFVWFLGIPMLFGVSGVAASFVPWFFGDGYEKVILLLQISTGLFLAIGLNNVTGIQYMIPTKRQNLFTLTVAFGAVINFGLNLYAIPRFFSVGAAVASVIAEFAIALLQFYLLRKTFSFKKVLSLSYNYFFAGILMYLGMHIGSWYIIPSVSGTAILVFVGISLYTVVLLILKDMFLYAFLSKIKHKLLS